MSTNPFTAACDAVTPSGDTRFALNVFTVARALCQAVLLCIAPVYAVLFVLMMLRQPDAPMAYLIESMLRVLAAGLLVETLFAVLWCRFCPVRVGDNGVAATDFWGHRLSMSWGEIETVTAKRFCGLPYLQVASFRKDRAVLWLPLFVREPDAMKGAIIASASARNPLRRFVEGREDVEPLAAR